MLYAIITEDHPGSLAERTAARPAHLARIRELADAGRLMIAGPLPAIDDDNPGDAGFTGSLIIAEFPCLEDARGWAGADPYVAAGVWDSITVKPFRKVLP